MTRTRQQPQQLSPFTVMMRRAPADIGASPAQRSAYLRATRIGDPAADEVVAMFRRLPAGRGRQMFDQAVEQGIAAVTDPPPELVAFFAEVDAPPYWVDPNALALAARVIGRTSVAGDAALSMGALLGGYLASRVSKTLVGTGDLTQMAPRRLAETMHWYAAVTAPGGLCRTAPGFKTTLRVRLMHALVRAGMHRRPDWDYDSWDHPVNQSTMSGTVMLFAVAGLTGSQAWGLHFSRHEKAAVYHLWRYIGFLLGVSPEILPATETDFWRLLWLQNDYEFRGAGQDSVHLAQALVQAIGPVVVGDGDDLGHRLGRRAVTTLLCAYARLLLGNDCADFLELPRSMTAHTLVAALTRAVTLLEVPRRMIPGATRWSETRGQRLRRISAHHMMTRHRGDASYRRHDTLASDASAATRRRQSLSLPPDTDLATPPLGENA